LTSDNSSKQLLEIVSSVEKEEDEQREFDGKIMILLDQQQHILYSTFKSRVVVKHNDNDTIITTIPLRVSVTGNLAFYAMFLGKDGMMSTKWCWLCKQSYQQWQNLNVDPSQQWTLKLIKDTASTLNNGGSTELLGTKCHLYYKQFFEFKCILFQCYMSY
jgi:hypothetical protein